MKILMIAINDPAGAAIEFTKAINRYTDHTCRLITKEIRYNFMFEKDLHLPWLDGDDWDEVEELLKTCDVFHFHMTADENIDLGPFKPVDYMRGKEIVHHHHGHPDFRGYPEKYRLRYKEKGRHNLLVSTPDLLKLLPEARWQPNLVPIDDSLYKPLEQKPNEPIIICHSPTRKDLKNTAEFLQVVNEIKKTSQKLTELLLIENTLHKECLRLKRESHILFDHLQGYFGVSSLEGLSQGNPVIAGLDDWNMKHICDFTEAEVTPWVVARSEIEMAEKLNQLINDREKRLAIGHASRSFMETNWNVKRIIQSLIDFYRIC